MFLNVAVDEFAEAVKRHDTDMSHVAYRQVMRLPGAGQILHLTFANPAKNLFIVAEMLIGGQEDLDEIESDLRSKGIKLETGVWMDQAMVSEQQAARRGGGGGPQGDFWVGCVAYVSDDDEPGLWMDAFPTEPTEETVLHTMYDEFRESGDLADVEYDDFVNEAKPTVQIIDSRDVQNWLRQKM